MSIKKINEFPDGNNTLTSDDIFLIMDDPSGNGITKKVSLSQLTGAIGSPYNAAVQWTQYHTLVDGTRYLANDLVYANGRIYKAKFDNESEPVSNTTYWQDLGIGYRLNIDGRDIQNIPYPVKSVNGQTGNITIPPAPVTSVNSQTGDVTVFDGNYNNLDNRPDLTQFLTSAPVTSVNGQTGEVTTGDITFSASTIATSNENQIITIVTNENNSWNFTKEGNTNLPEGQVINWGQNIDTLGPPVEGGATDRIRLWDFKGAGSNFNYAIGAEGNHVWFSMDVNNGTGGFKFYSRDNEIFKISDDSKLVFPNATTVAQGTYDNSTGGNNGISLNCAVGYELNWQGGHLKSTYDNGAHTSNILCDSPIEFPGSGTDNLQIDSTAITFPDGSTQNSAGVTSVAANISGASSITNMISISQANYDALGSKDPNTLYIIS